MFNSPKRNHISIVFERLGFLFFTLVLVGFNSLLDSLSEITNPQFWRNLTDEATRADGVIYVFGGTAFFLIAVTVLIVSLIYWYKTYFYIRGDDFIYERKTLFKKYSKLPIANIATVNLQRSVFERVAGTGRVKIDLNSSHTANRTDFSFVLRIAEAEKLRDTLLGLKKDIGVSADLPLPQTEQVKTPIISFSMTEVVRHRLLSVSLLQGAAAFFFVFVLPYLDGSRVWSIEGMVNYALLMFAVGGAALVWSSLNLGKYTVEKDDTAIYIQYGLIKKTAYSFSIDRINGVLIRQPVLARIFGLYSLEVAVVGLGNEKKESPRLCLLVNKQQMQRVLTECAPDFSCAGASVSSHKAALIPAAVTAIVLALIPGVFFRFLGLYTLPICAAVFAFAALGGWLSYKTKSVAFDDRVFHYAKGIFAKHKGMFKYPDIQDTRIKTNVLLRRLGAGRMILSILSSSNLKTHRTGYFHLTVFDTVSNLTVAHDDGTVERLTAGTNQP